VPKAGQWSTVSAHAYVVAVSLPSTWQKMLFAKSQLYVCDEKGTLLLTRSIDKFEFEARDHSAKVD
jgi:hypothetical protein